MIRNLKVLGLALVAAFAMSAVVASAASATSFWFTSDGDWTTPHGEQVGKDQFTVDFGKVNCEEATYEGSTSATTTTEITLKPTYGDCTPLIGFSTVTTNSCGYNFKTHTFTNNVYDVTTEIECSVDGDEITVDIYSNTKETTLICTVHIPEQTINTGVSLTNTGGDPNTITAVINITDGITYTQTAGTGLAKCPTTSLTHNGKYTGHATIEGENTAGAETSIGVST